MARAAIEIEGLTKRYGSVVAVDGLSFDVPRGSLFGFLGPNGSGKTTTLGMITGLVRPDEGTARIEGHDVREALPAALDRVGSLIEEPAFYSYLSGRRNLRVVARLRGVPPESADRALAQLGLAGAADRKYGGYSLGMRRRLGMAAALLPDPPVLLLDEPTNGLDPQGQLEARGLFRSIAAAGRTVLLSSHLLHEVQETCTHVAIVHKGRLLAAGELAEVLRGKGRLEIVVDDEARARRVLGGLSGIGAIEGASGRIIVEAEPALAASVNRALVEGGVAVSELTPRMRALEDLFLEMTQEAKA